MALSVKEASEKLGVSPSRVRKLIHNDQLSAERVGSQWVLDEAEVSRYQSKPRGRPTTPETAWQFLTFLPTVNPDILVSGVADRMFRWSCAVKDSPGDEMVLQTYLSLVHTRAKRLLFWADVEELNDLRCDHRLLLGGVSHPESGLLPGNELEAYVPAAILEAFVQDWFLVSATSERTANVVLHVTDHLPDELPISAVAADLAEHHGTRERAQAVQMIKGFVGT